MKLGGIAALEEKYSMGSVRDKAGEKGKGAGRQERGEGLKGRVEDSSDEQVEDDESLLPDRGEDKVLVASKSGPSMISLLKPNNPDAGVCGKGGGGRGCGYLSMDAVRCVCVYVCVCVRVCVCVCVCSLNVKTSGLCEFQRCIQVNPSYK